MILNFKKKCDILFPNDIEMISKWEVEKVCVRAILKSFNLIKAF